MGGTSLSEAKGVVARGDTPFVSLRGVPPSDISGLLSVGAVAMLV